MVNGVLWNDNIKYNLLQSKKMTSRGCTKSYNRKVNSSLTTSSIQFDKLFRENSNRPSAAKSAGTVGKWGITSFTSIRSTNINGKYNN